MRDESGAVPPPSIVGRKVADEPAPIFVSNAATAIEGAKFEKGTAEQFLALSGLKKEEVEFTGLDTFLKSRTGSVSKQEVLDYLDANGVRLGETVKGGIEEADIDLRLVEGSRERLEDDTIGFSYEVRATGERFDVILDEDAGNVSVQTEAGEFLEITADVNRQTDQDAIAAIETFLTTRPAEAEAIGATGPTKFATYTLPGGENYRELLITLARTAPEPDLVIEQADVGFNIRDRASGNVVGHTVRRDDAEGLLRPGFGLEELQADARRIMRERGPDFTGGHWDEPNVLVHVRFNERVDAEGKKILFIEEIQSDWHAKGRRDGYRKAEAPEIGEKTRLLAELSRVRDIQERNLLPDGSAPPFGTAPEYEAAVTRETEIVNILNQSGVPDAPFKKTWHELGLKRVIRWAAENDFDAVGWTTGAQQANRYDLSRHVGELAYNPRGGVLLAYDHERRLIINRNGVEPDQLPDFIGKDAADKLMAEPLQVGPAGGDKVHTLIGGELRVGGEPLKTFYDKMLPQAANRIGKKFGAKAGEGEIKTFTNVKLTEVLDREGRVVNTYGGRINEIGNAQIEAERIGGRIRLIEDPTIEPVHTFPITPALKDEVLNKGLPLFSSGAALTGLTADKVDVSPPDILLSDPFVPGEPPKDQETVINAP